MKKGLLALGLIVAGVGSVYADQPQFNFNAGGAYGVDTAPTKLSGGDLGGGQAGFEYVPAFIPNQNLGLNLDYEYLEGVKNSLNNSQNDIDLSLRYLPLAMGDTCMGILAGVGYNATPAAQQTINGRWLAFIGPQARVVLAPRAALDFGVQYRETTPKAAFVQSLMATFGVSIPLDGSYTMAGAMAKGK